MPPDQPALQALAALTASLVSRAVGACLAASLGAEDHSVVVELQQSTERPGLLGLRVCDDGVPLPDGGRQLERCSSTLAPLLVHPCLADGCLMVQSTGPEEVVVRQYRLRAAAAGTPAMCGAGDAPKPPGSTLRGTVFEAAMLLQAPSMQQQHPHVEAGSDGDGQAYVRQLLADSSSGAGGPSASTHMLLPSADAAVACLQQLLGMLRVLAPPVQLLLRLSGVQMQGPDGSLQRVSGTRSMHLAVEPQVPPLERFQQGMAAEFLPAQQPAALADAGQRHDASVGGRSVLDSAALLGSGRSTEEEEEAPSGVPSVEGAAAAAAGAASSGNAAGVGGEGAHAEQQQQVHGADVPPLSFLGVGEAGWGCAAAGQTLRGCKWTALAALVMQMPDHARLAAAAMAASTAGGAAGAGGSSGRGAAAGSSAQGPEPLPGPTPVFLFRSWGMQLQGQQAAVKGLERCDWANYGFQLERAEASADGPIAAVLRCAQPESGVCFTAAVVHLVPNDYKAAAEGRQPPQLAGSYESRLVRAALEAALRQLKQQCPAVVSSRRERSLARALPLLSRSLAGILLRAEHSEPSSGGGGADEEDSVLGQACAMLECPPVSLQQAIRERLQRVVAEALEAEDGGGGQEGGTKRARQEGGGEAEGGEASQA